MNILQEITNRIERRASETKNPCKLYKTESAAEKAGAKMAAIVGEHHDTKTARYLVLKVESLGKWTAAIDLTELLSRHDSIGGYVGLAANKGFYTY